jgi:predicted DNA-binding transcriptional regulator AlpA
MLPRKVLRFKELHRVGIRNYPTLRRWIDTQGFPPGRLIGPNTRVWDEAELETWWDSKADPPPENVKPAPLRQEGSRRIVKEDRHQSSIPSDSAAQATSREDEEEE